jgi:hemolysin activation/secretion protein
MDNKIMKKRLGTRQVALLLAAALIILPGVSWAVTPPTSTNSGVIMQGLTGENPALPTPEGIITVPPEETSGNNISTEKQFVLKRVVVDVPNLYNPTILFDMDSDYIGRMVSFADLNVIAQRVTKKYREDGYIFSRAILPPQKIIDGVVHLRAIEGRIIHISIVGHYSDRNGLIEKIANGIDREHAANANDIERHLLLINDLPGITAKSFIKPSAEAEGGDLIIDVEEKSIEGSVGVDNRGSDFLGPYRGTAVAAFNDIFGLHDRTTFRTIDTPNTRELKFGDITHEEQIGDSGAKITARAAFTSTNPGGSISDQEITGDSQMYDLEALYPLVRSRQTNFNLVAGVNAIDSTTDVEGLQTADDRVRSVRAGTRFDLTDQYMGVNQFEVMATQGITGLGATPDGLGRSRVNGQEDFLMGDVTATRVQQLPDLWSLMLSGTGQASDHPLPASEQFSLGGPTYGRAFDTGEVTGDDGYAGVAELRYGGPIENNMILQSYQAYTYIDYGRVLNQDTVVGEFSSDSLTSAGLGVRVNMQYGLSGYAELDKPMDKAPVAEGDNGSRLFFSVLKRF